MGAHTVAPAGDGTDDRPAIAVRESKPGRAVFVEDGNTEGWIASDRTVEVTR